MIKLGFLMSQKLYESMKMRVEHVMEKGKINDEYIRSHEECQVFKQWTHKFTIANHPTIIQVGIINHIMQN